MASFSATISNWTKRVPEAIEAVMRGSAQDLVQEMQAELNRLVYEAPISPSGYQRTGFLRASLVASTSSMPQLVRENDGTPVSADEMPAIILAIDGWDGGETLWLGYTAKYSGIVHSGGGGAIPRPWVTLTAQKWREIVERRAADVKQRFGL